MKKNIIVLLVSFFVYKYSFTQDTIRLRNVTKDPKSDRYRVVTDRPPQTVFGELLGSGILFSVHYDRRFEKRTDGFGFRVGLTTLLPDEDNLFIYVFGVNHLIGNNKKGRFFESGINFTGLSARSVDFNNGFVSLTLGYRSQPVNGDFVLEAELIPYL